MQDVLSHPSERARTALMMVALFVSYVASARLGIELSVAQGVITPVWAPTGISIAALVLYGPRLWPAVALGALVANTTSGASGIEALFISVGNTLEAVVGSVLLRRADFRPALDRVKDVLSFVLIAAVASTAIAATNGVTTLWISGEVSGSDYGSRWLLWWIGDAMGALLVAPLILVFSTRPWHRLANRSPLEGLVLLVTLVSVSSIVFLGGQWRYPHLLFPLLIWATLRFRQLGAVTSSFIVGAVAIAGAIQGTTPLGNDSTTEIVQILEALTAGVTVSLLILGAVLSEQRGREQAGAGERKPGGGAGSSPTSGAGSGTSPRTGSPGRTSSTASTGSSPKLSRSTTRRTSRGSIRTTASASRVRFARRWPLDSPSPSTTESSWAASAPAGCTDGAA